MKMAFNLFLTAKIPKSLPKEMNSWISKLRKLKNREACVRKAYEFITKKFRGERIHMRYNELFITNPEKLWKKKIIFCTTFNWLMKILLIKSGKFRPNDIRIKWSLIWYISLHQYLNIKINNNEKINIDLWGKDHGIKFGDYAHGFH